MQPGSFVRNLKEPYMGLCIVLEIEGTRVRMWSERGRYDVETTRAQLVESSPESAIRSESPDRLMREYQNFRRRKQLAEYNTAVKLARLAMGRCEFAAAIELLTKALQLEPASYDVLTERAHCRRMMRNYEDAIRDYNVLIGSGAASEENFLGRAMCFEALGHLEGACADATSALEINTNNAQAHDMLGRVCGKLAEKYNGMAEDHIRQARRIRNPTGNLGPLFD